MTPLERRATLALAGIYALRMLGLFMMLPVLALFAEKLEGSTPFLIGLSVSIYGLSQALLQIPFGLWSDRFGRKKVIVAGLLLFIAGSIVAALSTTIYGVLAGRALQGSGAIAAAVMALAADLTQEVHRTKAMATIGASIGIAFGVAVTLGPIIANWIGVQGIFWVTAALAVLAIIAIVTVVPDPPKSKKHRDAEVMPEQMSDALKNPDLLRLNYGIFVLHLLLTATFVVVPLLMRDAGLLVAEHWKVYLGVMVTAMIIMVPFIIIAEKKRKMKVVFMGAIATLILADLGLMLFNDNLTGIIIALGVFFCGFNLLEATLPSLISKTAPADLKGTAMGVYSTSQFLGAFIGGAAGGWSYGQWGAQAVFLLCILAAISWLLVSMRMNPPRYWANLLISLEHLTTQQADKLATAMLTVKGVEDVTLHYSEGVAYLKVDNQQLDKERLQAVMNQGLQA
ncbi:MAG: MFS transporter [Methylococcaceae bacterium]|nr:MFS transporter [Methylococcaceae bacterium]